MKQNNIYGEKYPENWPELRKQILSRDDWMCVQCGNTERKLHVHHITPISEGGSHETHNLETLCSECHAEEHDEMPCEICDLFADKELLELANSHGGMFYACEKCFDNLQAGPMCGICGDETNGKYTLTEMSPDGFSSGLCDECRKRTVFRHQFGHIENKLRSEGIERFYNYNHNTTP